MSDSQRPISSQANQRLTDEQVLELFTGSPPDTYSVLSRRGRKTLSDDSVVRMLAEAAPPSEPGLIPTAQRANLPPRRLDYAPNRLKFEIPISTAPAGYRIIRVGLWLGVAAAMVAVMSGRLMGR